MQIFIETDRLIIRELLPSDDAGIFELDSDPEVHEYLGRSPIKNIEEARDVIAFIREQYITNGIGRWAMVEKTSGNFIGWTGLKLIRDTVNNHTHFYDLGYRLIKKYWGKGYATESAIACRDYGFNELNQPVLYAITDVGNVGSRKVLEKAGFTCLETFDYDGVPHFWLEGRR
ncbi:GNAT family N-acetyltransferase [Mucilaginibacter jinjuensis]|uniref:GNAT family N-acetyltransferase n=1 Tax=Mucilaginibacter jinjuensis TaxID=1176721 RepID=A0ABY7T9X8_9SPHI|nr:GNAT family N-acetyltransferase [Mucilaginibacter jinjuensis]WCT13136.1 GNAT family N-acetyltransferase [Mucilaginibacter jinjuensis]